MSTEAWILAISAIATMVLAVTAVKTFRGKPPRWWSKDELRALRSELVRDAAEALLARENWPVVLDVVATCFEMWERELLANPSWSRVEAKSVLRQLLNRQLSAQMGYDYQDALQRGDDRSALPSVDFGTLSIEAAHKIARSLAPAMRQELTRKYWRHNDGSKVAR